MAAINKEEFDYLARLSNLSFSDGQRDMMMRELSKMSDFVDAVANPACLADEEHGLPEECTGFRGMCDDAGFNGLREDVLGTSVPAEKLLENTESENEFFKVKQVKL